MTQERNNDKLWTAAFLILWQGQLVSTLGDAAYSIALGFWVLEVTGSTALMGMLMAASTLPGVLMSPFAGVLVDRYKRKNLLILMDLIRGLSIMVISIAAFKGMLAIWEVFAAGIILSICGAVFRPGVNSSIPDIVPISKLEGANSMLSMATSGSNMIGNVAGGFLFQSLGAPILFLFNGLSYLFSGASICFVKIPLLKRKSDNNFFQDMKEGFSFMWKFKGLRYILFMAAVLNFFSFIGIVLNAIISENIISWSR
ncbi:MFS transporter [Clostridium sp. SHJSY1]|uniref:MFS transporter n=1 Tax=Clostridium sp. SHJSY1 TaxID=2942483 RepID=UPI0028745FD4|nr:MFS transporter [Clostridium sp. SHJSY1]MDS0527429.1 MFS transporter [Clostridium sp. SHJSY1]